MLLKDLLDIPTLRDARIAAGAEGLNRSVSSVNMMDAPDIIHYLKRNELLLTTAYAVKDQLDTLETLVSHMADAGCAGLAIKTKRFLEEIPDSVIEQANRLALPILELPLDYSLGEVLNSALSRILQSKSDELSYAMDTHHAFFNLILQGEGLSEIVEKLAELIGAPVMILSAKHELVGLSSIIKPRMGAMNKLIAQLSAQKQTLPAGLYQIEHAAPSDGAMYAMIQAIPTFQWQGYIIAFTNEGVMNKLHALAMEQAANVLGYELLKSQAVKDRARRFKIDFFSELVQGEIKTEEEIVHRGKQYGLFPSEIMLCVVCGRDSDEGGDTHKLNQAVAEQRAREIDQLYHRLNKQFSALDTPYVLFTLKDKCIAILSSKELLGSADGKRLLARHLIAIADNMASEDDIQLSFGIGSPFNKLLDIPAAYKQALEAYQLARANQKQRFVQFYHTKEFADLLRLIPYEDLQEYLRDTFEPWGGIDENEQKEWHKTLRVFYDNHCHIGETAKQLYIHRNTVLYRLNRIEQLTGTQVRNPADSLRIRMALLIKELIS
ncbi:PucR family transcriptional regulator [Paenibacillus sp. HB172176]|uniref:PucR family transcriptional regulator n=1 Tax=Paenibacillus sp. HB172176 TaxID=2493690 RepID=UPI00143A0AF8|nr:PucR family transcriptional regulator [Paenibacillus sp. HB172176]